jgi:hypothetical protein
MNDGAVVMPRATAGIDDTCHHVRRTSIMKNMLLWTLMLGVVVVSAGCSPSYRTQQGAVIGAALGAWAGQDIGRNTESTLIGAALGGMAGAVIGDAIQTYEQENAYYPYNHAPYQPYQPAQRPPRR